MCWAPLDLMIIAGLLKKENISSKIFDANSIKASWDDVKKIVEEEKPKIVIFTTSTPTVYHDLKTADIVKEVSKDIFTAITSTHVNALPEEALQLNNNLDFAIPNDSEFTFLELICMIGGRSFDLYLIALLIKLYRMLSRYPRIL